MTTMQNVRRCGLHVELKNVQNAWHVTTTTTTQEYCKSVGKHVEKLQIMSTRVGIPLNY